MALVLPKPHFFKMDIHPFAQICSLLFFGILFTQSGLDKVMNYQGNYDWLQSHFAKSPLKNTVGIMMPVITLMETAAGLLCLIGMVTLHFPGMPPIGLWGLELSTLSIIALFFGQRLAQDYEGAATLATYFGVCLLSLYLFSV